MNKKIYCLSIFAVALVFFWSAPLLASPGHGAATSQAERKGEGSGGKKSPHGGSHHGKTEGSKKSYSGHHGKSGYSGHGHYGSGPFKHILQFKGELGLTEEQIAFIKNEKFKYEKIKIELGAAHKISHMELDRALHSEKIDENKINQIVDDMVAQKTQKIRSRIAGKLAVLKALSDEQRKLISAMYNRHN